MSFRDSSNSERQDNCSALGHSRWRSDSKEGVSHGSGGKPPTLAVPTVVLLDSPACSRGAQELDPVTDNAARLAAGNIIAASGTPAARQQGNATSESDAFSDAASVQSKADKPGGLSCCGSARSSLGNRSHLRHRVIYPSAPITFTKGLTGAQPWEGYGKTPPGYLDEETVRAAAAADESIARRQQLKPSKHEAFADVIFMEGDGGKSQGPEAPEALPANQQDGECTSAHVHPSSSVSQPPIKDTDAIITSSITNILGDQHVQRGPSVSATLATNILSSGRRNHKQKPLLGSWILGGGGTGTEIERLLKEENEIADALAARNELTERKLLQEDMEAMIENLQQVKGFLVKKLRECETALLTTAQERDGLEATLQHVQSGIQDTIAEHRRLVDEYKSQLTAKTQETEELGAQLQRTAEENERLQKENKTLLNEVAVARAEAADVAAARGFHIEEYQRAVQALIERNKAQHREVKRLRGQLIKTREDYANVLARVDELESLADFQRTALQDVQQSPPAQPRKSSWRITKVLQRRARSPDSAERSQQSSDASSPISSQRNSEDADVHAPSSSVHDSCRVSPITVGEGEIGAAKLRDNEKRLPVSEGSRTVSKDPDLMTISTTPAASPQASSLGRSVTGLLAFSVSRVLQTFEHAVATDRELEEALDQDLEDCPEASEPMPLHEEAALFLKRTSESSDIVVQLEDGTGPQQPGVVDGDEPETLGDSEASTLGNVARTVWQAANELLSERALPPARLSSLRTIAASTPSAWEVILERHRAAKSMPLFSSLPPTAFPMLAEGKNDRREILNSKSSSAVTGSAMKPSVSFGESGRRNLRRPPSTGSLNMRPYAGERGRSERLSRESQHRGVVSVELRSEPRPRPTPGASESGEVLVWQVEASNSPSNSASTGLRDADERKLPTRLDSSCLESPTCEVDDVKEDIGTQTTQSQRAAATGEADHEPHQCASPDSARDSSHVDLLSEGLPGPSRGQSA
ncbi:hypothetical protein Emag_003690 [Eimeria magna]